MDVKLARVLVVEDEKIMATFLLGSLRRLGILDLFACTDGLSALREIGKIKPDLIISDVHMKPMGGLEFVRLLRASDNMDLANTPVIFLSADSSASTVGEAMPLGVAGYLLKPPKSAALEAKIAQALKGYKTTIFD